MIPIQFHWDGEVMRPHERFQRACNKQYVVGQDYPLIPVEERSMASHRGYFAALTEGWRNLPEDMADEFVSPEHLRKFCLIKAGYCNKRSIVCASLEEAGKVAAFIKPLDEFALVTSDFRVVNVYTAQSQALSSMDKATFKKSRDDVLDIIASMIDVTVEELKAHANVA